MADHDAPFDSYSGGDAPKEKIVGEPSLPKVPDGSAASDHSLLQRYRDGNEDGASQLFARYFQRLRAFVQARCSPQLAARVDADDIVQSAFRSFFRAAHAGIYQVPAGEHLWQLLLTITLNKLRAQGVYHSAAKRDVRLTQSIGGAGADQEILSRQDEIGDVFLQMVFAEALEQLPPPHRALVDLRMQGYDIAGIAEQSGRSKRTVERMLQQAFAQLRIQLEQEE